MDPKLPKPMTFNWPLLSPRRPRSPSSFCSSSALSSRVPSFSSDITEFYDAAEDWSGNIEQESVHLKAFTFKELKRVTGNFRHDRVIGEGGLGRVYKGWIDEQTFIPSRPGSGMAVAVKIWNQKSLQGHAAWQTEALYLGQLLHPNIVKLIGLCSEDDHLALVYEYVQRGSLENHLFRGRVGHPLSWASRIKIAIGIAKGLSFLHDAERPIIFRDVKSSNVLLDTEFNVKLGDFGFAIAGPAEDETHISTEIIGTKGYAAPEYIATGRLSVKCDVYSFGVVLLELLSGFRTDDHARYGSLVDWARPYLADEMKRIRCIDPKLEGQYPKEGVKAVAMLALRCISTSAKLRPRMSEVLTELEQLRD